MSKTEATTPLRERQEAMLRLWPDHPGVCTLRVLYHRSDSPDDTHAYQCGVALHPLTVDRDYLSVRCPSCRVVTIHQRIIPLDG